MMHGTQKSDSPVVAVKPANKPEHLHAGSGAEPVEPRGGAKGNAGQSRTCRTQSRESVFQRLDRVRQAARLRKKERFTALMHLVDIELLRQSYFWLQKNAAAGVDGITWHQYGEDLEQRLVDLHGRIHRNAYQATPSRRQYIPKSDGRLRPLGIAALEDKIVQRAVVEVLNAVFETDFLGFSYGFRPKRSQHQALDALAVGIARTNVSWIVDADIRSFFDTVSHEWLIKFVEHRIGDPRIVRLIGKWLKAGTLEEGVLVASEEGTPQGAVITPWTQKAISNLSGASHCGERVRYLTYDAKGNIFASNVAIQRRREGPSLERCIRSAPPRLRCRAGLGVVDRRVRLVPTPSVSLRARSPGDQAPGAYRGAQRGHDRQGARGHRGEATRACAGHGFDDRRCGLARRRGLAESGASACLSATSAAKSTLSIALIVCSAPSSNRSTTSWFPIAPAAPVGTLE